MIISHDKKNLVKQRFWGYYGFLSGPNCRHKFKNKINDMDKGSEELRRNEEIRNKGELRKEFLTFKTTDFASSML